MAEQTCKDLRGDSRDYKRAHDKHHKWGNGVAWGPGRLPTHHPRPAKGPRHINENAYYPPPTDPKTVRTRAMRQDYSETVTDSSASSAEEDEIPVPAGYGDANEADVAYSYDNARGPSTGSKVLGFAVEQAVERFENKATDKLVKDEYLVLDDEGEPVPPATGRSGKGKNSGKKVATKATSEELDLDLDEEYEFV